MSEIREKLKPYLNTRVQVRGTYAKWDEHWKTGIRQTGRACIANPEIDAEVVCPYVWAVDAPNWKEHRNNLGLQVAFDAVVMEYTERATGRTNYCLSCPSDPTFLTAPPALRIPDPPRRFWIGEDSPSQDLCQDLRQFRQGNQNGGSLADVAACRPAGLSQCVEIILSRDTDDAQGRSCAKRLVITR